MADLKNIKNVSFQLDEKAKLRAAIGLNSGMALGMLAAFIAIILSNMNLLYKIFAAFGLFCACVLQVAGVIGAIQRLKAYNAAMEEYAKMTASSQDQSQNKPQPANYHG